MPKAEEPVSDLWVGNQSAYFYMGAEEVIVHPGLLVHRDSPILAARPGLFDPLVLSVLGLEDEPGSAAIATVLVVSDKSAGPGHGTEVTRVLRYRTRPAAVPW